jgi:hypothetical protein
LTVDRNLGWLEKLPVGCIGTLSNTTYACKDNIIHNGFAERCMFVYEGEPWCYLGWDDDLLKHQLVSITILYKESKWEVLAQPHGSQIELAPFSFLTNAIISLDEIEILMR